MTVLHSGSNKKYANNWDTVFAKRKTGGASTKKAANAKKTARKSKHSKK